MFTKGLSKQTQKNLEILDKISFVSKYYLAGGTALSLYYGHRFSNDLDFFSQKPEKPLIIASCLSRVGKLEIFQNDVNTFNGKFNKVNISFFFYPYKLLQPFCNYKNIKLASIDDIACMKIEAISSRGTKRDFIDLYTIINNHKPLPTLLKLFKNKFRKVNFNLLHIVKSLAYFQSADKDEIPNMIAKASWNEIQDFFKKEVKKLFVSESFTKY